eukprot:20415-Heterococcus_DN1.PRE.3
MTDNMQKCTASDSSNPLVDLGMILQNVLSYVGPGHCLFMAPVNKMWKDLYDGVESQKLTINANTIDKAIIVCVPAMTLYSSVLSSPSRVQLAHGNALDCTTEAYQRAAGKHGDIATLAAAHNLGMQCTVAVMAAAAKCNKLAEVQYLHEQGCPWSRTLLEGAASCGHLELARWCHEHGCPWQDISQAPVHAAKSGNVKLMAWVLQLPGTQLQVIAMKAAASRGRTDMCKYLHAQQCPWGVYVTADAARGGHVDVLRWLIDSGCPWDETRLCRAAAHSGNMNVLTFLQQQLGLLTSAAVLTKMLHDAGYFNKLAAAK